MKNIWKKTLAAGICAAMACSFAGCVSPESVKFVKDGTYTGTAAGYSGDIEVSVTYKDNKMTDIKITKNSEPGVVAYSAMKDIPAYILENQSTNVDVSTGATTTSKAICDAVASTVTPAGGNPEQWTIDCTGKHKDKEVNYTTQAVIVGGGFSGILTALRLQQEGVETLIVEKQPKVGGSLNYMFNSMQITAGSTSLHKDNVADEEADAIAKDIYSYGNNLGNQDLIKLLTDNIGKVTDWQIKDLGMSFADKYGVAGYSSNAARYYDNSDAELYELLTKEVKVSGSKIVPNAAVIGIDYTDGKASGVTAKAVDGSIVKVKADYVILASGSYGTNQSMLNDTSSLYYGPLGASGDMITTGKSEANNFSILSQNGGASFFTGFQLSDSNAVDSYNAVQRCLTSGALIINQNGQRFINEDAEKNVLSTALSAQTSSYIVLNNDGYRAFKAGLLVNMSDAQKKVVLGEDDASTNIDTKYKSDNLKDACEKYGLDYDTVSNTVDAYNALVKSKIDLTYQRSKDTFGTGIDSSKECYIIPFSMYIYATMGGIACNTSLNVLKTDGTAADNIYAIGNACGNVFGNGMKQGAGSAWAAVSAYLAAEDIIAKNDAVYAKSSASASTSASASATTETGTESTAASSN